MPNSKTPGNDGLSFEFYEEFWNKLRDPILNSFYHAKTYKEFSSSQRPAVIEFLDKEGQGQNINKQLETNLIVKYWSKCYF